MTTLKELLDVYNDGAIMETLFALYPDQEENEPGYRYSLAELRMLTPTPPTWRVTVEWVKAEDDELSEEDWVNVSGVEEDDPLTYAIEYEPFERWLGAEIDAASFEVFDPLDIVAHCLFEMTWTGYSNEERERALDAVTDIYEDATNCVYGANGQELLN